MSQTVEIPDHGIAEFPDDMTPDQIKGVIQSKFYASPTPAATTQAGEVAPPVIQEQGSSGPTIDEQRAMLDKVPEGVKAPLEAAAETVSGFIPKSVGEVAGLAGSFLPPVQGVQDIGRGFGMLKDVLFGDKTDQEIMSQRFPETQIIPEAEKTPPFSKERYKAGFDTLAQLGMAAGVGRGLTPKPSVSTTAPPLTETLFGKEKSPLVDAVNEGLTEAEQQARYGTQPLETPNASEIPSTESVTQPEVRTPVGEGAPLRQQGETPEARQRIEAQPETPQLEVAPPVSEAPVSTTATPLTQTERSISGNKTPVAQTGEAGTGGVVGRVRKFSDAWDERGLLESKALMSPKEFARMQYGTAPPADVIPTLERNHAQVVADALANGLRANPEAVAKYGLEVPSVSVEGQAPTGSVKPETSATSQEIPTGSGIQKEAARLRNEYQAARDSGNTPGMQRIQYEAQDKGISVEELQKPATEGGIENASKEQITEKTNGGLRTRSWVEELPPGNVKEADARLRSDQGVQTPEARQGTEAGQVAPEPISTKNAYTEAQRAIRGMPEAEQAAKRGFGKVWDEAAAQSEKDPTIGRRLVAEINAKPRPISDVENAHLLRREIEAQKEHSDAVDAVNTATTDSDLTAAKARLESARNDLQDVYDATKSAGTKSGQALAARQMLAKEDYSLAKMEARRRAANDGKPLNETQLAETKALNDKITELQSKLDAHEVAARFNNEFNKLVEQSRKEAKASKAQGTRFTDFMDRKANEARARIEERRGRLTTGFDPTAITDEAVIGASHIAKGLTKFADWSVEMAKEFGDQIRPFLKDLWERSKAFHDANAKEYGDKALARYKTYLGKQTEQIKSKLEAGDFTKAQRQKTQLDKEAFNMRADLQKLKNQFERGVAKEAYQNKSPAQKFWDHFVGVERAMKLSGPEVFGKLGVAAAVREALAPIESGVGFGVSRVFPALAKGTKYEADFGSLVRAELKAKAALFTDGIRDAAQNVKGQETGLDAIGKQKIRPDFWYNRIGQMHAAIKAPVKRAEFTRDLTQRMAVAIKNGEDINHPEVMTRLANESVMEANRAIFQNKTVVSGFFSMLERQSPAAGRVARFLFPVVKIPVNLFKELVNLHVGAPVGAARVGMAYWKGVETLPVVQREAIIRQLTKGSIGGAGLLWGYYNSDKVRNFFDHVPTWFNHTPMAMILNEGSYLKKLEQGGAEAKKSTKELKYMAKTDIPFMYTIKDIGDALSDHNSNSILNWINNMTQSTVVPQISTQVAKQMDKPGTFPSNLGEKPTYRPATNPIDAVKLGIPGLRQTVPVKEKKHTGVSRRR